VSTDPAETYDPERCTPCRGTGTVISGLGGEPKPVTCPWCEGSGVYQREHDAQAARRED
jgi:DnaJ-class molecular chaperone